MALVNGGAILLQVTPSGLDFGDVTTGQTAQLVVTLRNLSFNGPITITSITSDNGSFVAGTLPTTIAARATATVTITYTAGAVGAATGTLTIDCDSDNAPIPVALVGNSVAAGTKAISISPSSWIFDPTKTGVDSATVTFVITNTGTVDVTVQIPVVAAPFSGVGLPGAPTVIAAGGTLSFGVKFTPVAAGYIAKGSGISITSDAPSSVDHVDLEGMGVGITPAYVVSMGAEATYTGFRNTVKKFDPADLNCESAAFAERTFVLAGPGVESRTMRLELQYEDKGEASVNVKITGDHIDPTTSLAQTKNQDVAIGTVAAGSTLAHGLADLGIEGEFAIIRLTPTGPLSLVAYIPRFVPAGEVVK